MSKYMAEFISILETKPSHARSFVSKNWNQFSNEEQKQITLVLLYALQVIRVYDNTYCAIANELREMYKER